MLADTASMGVSSKYPRTITGIRENGQTSIQRKGFLVQIGVPWNRSEKKHALGCGYQKISAVARNKKCYDGFGSLRRYCLPAELENPESEPDRLRSLLEGVWMQLNALHRFSRPHTVWGTVIGIISVSLLTVETSADISSIFIVGLMKALLPSIFMNIYVVGLNQLFDVEIDKVNKPDLPLASGKFSMEVGIAIVAASCIVSFAMGLMFQSPALLSALLFSFLVGSAYSIDVPFLRWKRHAFLAATSILSVRAIVVQFAYFVHMQKYVLGRPIAVTRSLIFATAFMCFFSAVIALFKVFWLCVNLLLTAYIAAMVVGVSSPFIFSKIVMVLGHGAVASILWHRGQSVDLKDKASITSFYMFIWKLFYAEYLLIPFVR